MTIYLLGAFLVSLICGLVFTPLILDFCKRKRLYDIPNERKVHKNATPRLGGISFFPSMLTAFFIVLLFTPIVEQDTLPVNVWSAVFLPDYTSTTYMACLASMRFPIGLVSR